MGGAHPTKTERFIDPPTWIVDDLEGGEWLVFMRRLFLSVLMAAMTGSFFVRDGGQGVGHRAEWVMFTSFTILATLYRLRSLSPGAFGEGDAPGRLGTECPRREPRPAGSGTTTLTAAPSPPD